MFVIDEREAKADMKPMTCSSPSRLRGAPKIQFPKRAVRLWGLEDHVVTLDLGGGGNFHNGAALSEWKTQLWANCGHSMRVKLKRPFSRT